MSIQFNEIQDQRNPFIAVEFDGSAATSGVQGQFKAFMTGQKLSSGSEAELTSRVVSSSDEAGQLYGFGSQLHSGVKAWFANNPGIELTCMAIDDLVAGNKATGKIAFSGTATESGVLAVYVAGQRYQVPVTVGDDGDAVSAAVVAAITADTHRMVDATVNGTNANEADVSARNAGLEGNDYDIRINYAVEDVVPAGITSVITAMVSGAGNPDVGEVIAAMPDEQYKVVMHPWTDSTNLSAVDTEMNSRASASRQVEGVAYHAKIGSLSDQSTYGNTRNSAWVASPAVGKASVSTAFEWAVSFGSQVGKAASISESRPFKTLELQGVYPLLNDEVFTKTERETLLFDGMSTVVMSGGVPRIGRGITNYQTNGVGAADTAFLELNKPYQLSRVRQDTISRFALKYPRSILKDDGPTTGEGIMTPKVGQAEMISLAIEWEQANVIEDLEQFQEDLIVQRNPSNVNRLDISFKPNFTNQFLGLAAKALFIS